jgi:hypothetical protein
MPSSFQWFPDMNATPRYIITSRRIAEAIKEAEEEESMSWK